MKFDLIDSTELFLTMTLFRRYYGSEFTSKAMFFWAKKSGVKLAFIQPGKPTQNAFVESFNWKFRAACLNQHWFRTLDEARDEIEISHFMVIDRPIHLTKAP